MPTAAVKQSENLNKLLEEYQIRFKQEKLALLKLELPRKRLKEILQEIREPASKQRRISGKLVDLLLSYLDDPRSEPSTFYDKLQEIKLSIDAWCQLRVEAEKMQPLLRKNWQNAFESAAEIRSQILTQMVPIVAKVRVGAVGYRGQNADDLDGVGFLALIKAIENFDLSRKVPFEAYARSWIYNAMVQHLRKDNLINPSEKVLRTYRLYDQKRQEMEAELGRAVDDAEVAEQLSIHPDELENLLSVNTTTTSLDAEVGEDEEGSLHDILGQEESAPYQEMEMKMLARSLHQHMSKLSNPELSVLLLRWYPLKHSTLRGEPMPLEQAVEEMQKIALERLKSASMKN